MAIRVLIVDDSLLFRETLAAELRKDPEIDVVGTASDPYEARDKIVRLQPDVMTLDVEMPKMDGIAFLKKLLPQYPLPVIVSSAASESVFDALGAGAVDFIAKPQQEKGGMPAYAKEMINCIRGAVHAKIAVPRQEPVRKVQMASRPADKDTIIAIGASTGGTEAIFSILTKLPANMPGIVIVQHMPEGFTELYAERLNKSCAMQVREARNGDEIRPGLALLAPGGDLQMTVVKTTLGYSVRCLPGEKVSGHRPSVDVLFDSVADAAGRKALGIILTGMGADGAKGLLKMRQKGAYTIGQDEKSSVVYGMPMVAWKNGAVTTQLSLYKIPQDICRQLSLGCERA